MRQEQTQKHEIENQRYGRNKSTIVNQTYINSGGYRRKFDLISENSRLNRLLYQLAKTMLTHRSGTLYEDMYWIDPDAVCIVASEVDQATPECIQYSTLTASVIQKYQTLFTVHTHPNSFPPSLADLNANYLNHYALGIILCHDGTIYVYNADEIVDDGYYTALLTQYKNLGCSDFIAQKKTLREISAHFNVQIKEVKNDNVL